MAQVPKACQICAENIQIRWKCLNCKTLLCNECGQRHVRDELYHEHQVVDLDNIERMQTYDFTKCSFHPKNSVSLYCWECKQTICVDCLGKSHHGHTLETIEDARVSMKKTLWNHQAKINSQHLNLCYSEKEKIQKEMRLHKGKFEDEKQKILEYDLYLKEEISHRTELLLEELIDEIRTSAHDINTRATKLDYRIKMLHKTNSAIENKKESFDIHTLRSVTELSTNVLKLPVDTFLSTKTLPCSSKQFCPGQSRQELEDVIKHLAGSLKTVQPYVPSSIEFKSINSFSTDLTSISSIKSKQDGTILISSNQDTNFRQVDLEQEKILEEDKNMKFHHFAITKSNTVLFAIVDNNCIKEAKNNGQTSDFYIFSSDNPTTTTALHVTNAGLILVSTIEEGGLPYTITDTSQRQVMVLSECGDILRIHESDPIGHRLFLHPDKLTSNDGGEICVIDKTSQTSGIIVIIDSDHLLKWIFHGIKEEKFDPIDIVTTPTGNLVISESHGTLLIMNYDCVILKKQSTIELGIEFPHCLDINNKGLLTVTSNRQYFKHKAKLFLFKFSGF
ncbi:E3 ubiquitin-protein ligase Trim36-like [Mytilus trossulus]|uniref:E3 ubiquitin-protein ligase Trim36-like n=1 Tax=Mytilus trossulus TaxID=6551 RepID=UPI003006A3C9